jgi:predicted phosphodiesterase
MAKYAVLSDIHSNLEALTVVLEKCRELGITNYLSLGDVVGYNANPNECLALVRSLNIIARVRGNHDDYAVRGNIEESGFNGNAKKAILWTREQISEDDRAWLDEPEYEKKFPLNCTLVHATLDTPSNWGYILDSFHAVDNFSYQKTNVCFCGHSHVPVAFVKKQLTAPGGVPVEKIHAWSGDDNVDYSVADVITVEYRKNNKYLFNVGSIGQPRNGDPRASFAVWDTDAMTVTRYCLPYDYRVTQQKILDAGLPGRLAERLAYGS